MAATKAGRYGRLPTEQPNPASRRIDTKPIRDILRVIAREDARVPRAVRAQGANIARAAEILVDSWRRGGRWIFIGAGTSGRLGVMEAAECPPTFGVPSGRIRAVMAGGRSAVFMSKEGAEDDASAGAGLARRGDAVVGIAASGVTPFVRGALSAARRRGCRTILVTANARSSIRDAQVVIAPDVGPEVLAGSTRLKSATAAKLVLNALTTAAMIRLGKVYDHWMADLRPTSFKLRQRSLRMLCDLGKVPLGRAQSLLGAAGGSVKTAIVMARLGVGAAQARRRLEAADGFLRRVLEGLR